VRTASTFPIASLWAAALLGCAAPSATKPSGHAEITKDTTAQQAYTPPVPGVAPSAKGLSPSGKAPCARFSCPAGMTVKVQENVSNDAQYWRCDGESSEAIPILGCVKAEIVEQGATLNGKKEGPWISPRGSGWRDVGFYKDGRLHGEYREIREGKVYTEATFEMGQIQTRRRLHGNGGVKEFGRYKDGEMQGEWKSWHPDGALASSEHYENGRLQGRSAHYSPAGEVLSEAFHRAGRAHGPTRKFQGEILVLEEHWVDGRRHGAAVTRDPQTGHRLSEGRYDQGSKAGEWRSYRRGELYQTEEFIQGRLTKRCTFAGGRRCTEFAATRSAAGCRVTLPEGKHIIARSDSELFEAIDCPQGQRPEIDWETEQVFVARFSRQSNAGRRWTSFREKDRVILQLQVGFACQGTRIKMHAEPTISIVETGGLPLHYRLETVPNPRCGAIP